MPSKITWLSEEKYREIADAFIKLWDQGHRLNLEDFQIRNKIKDDPETYEIITLDHLKKLVKTTGLNYNGIPFEDEEELEMTLSMTRFFMMFKS
jgi:hypothetical protein